MHANRNVWKTAVILFGLTAGAAFGADAGSASHRMSRRVGVTLSYGDPYPTVIGLGAAYHITDFLKAQVGFGKLSVSLGAVEASATTIGLGLKGTVPGWNFTPTVGLHWAHVGYSGTGILNVGGFTDSGSHLYTSFGFDWQTQSGFNLAGGYQYSFKSGIGGGIFLSAGWFVDWLG